MRKTNRISILVTALITSAAAQYGHSASWEAKPEINLRTIYSDNIALNDAQEESDFITDISPRIVITADGNRLDLQFDYSIQNLIYFDNSERNNTNHRLNTKLTTELVEDLFFFEGLGRVSQQLVDRRQGLSYDRISGSQNSEDVYGFSLSPYITPRLGNIAEGEIRYTYDYVDSESDNQSSGASSSFNDSEGDRVSARIQSGEGAGKFSWDVNYDSRKVDYEDGDKTDTELLRTILSYRLSRKFTLNATWTDEENEFIGDRGNNSPDDSFYGGGVTWHPTRNFSLTAGYNKRTDPRPDEDETFGNGSLFWSPTPRTQLQADYGNRFFGETYNFSFDHRMRRSSWRIFYNEGVADFRQQFLEQRLVGSLICPIGFNDFQQCRIFDANNPPQLNEQVVGLVGLLPSFSNDTYINKRLSASWSIRGGKNVITLSANRQDREYVADQQDERDLDINLSWSYQIAPQTTSLFSVQHRKDEFEDGEESTDIGVTWSLTTRLSPKSNVSLELYLNDRDADTGSRDYSENRVTLSFQHFF